MWKKKVNWDGRLCGPRRARRMPGRSLLGDDVGSSFEARERGRRTGQGYAICTWPVAPARLGLPWHNNTSHMITVNVTRALLLDRARGSSCEALTPQ